MISGNKTHSREGFWPPDSSGKPEGPPTLGQLITSISLFNTCPTLTAQTLTAGQHHQPTQLCSACLDVGGRVTRWDHSSSRCLYKQQISYPTNSHTSRSPLNHGPGTGLFAPLFKNTGQGNAQTSELWKAESFNYIPLCSSNGLPWWLRCWRVCRQCRRPGFDPWVRKIHWRREWPPTPVFWPGESHGQRSLVGYSPWGHKEPDTTEQLTHTQSQCQ